MSPSTTGWIAPAGPTVSMCAESRNGGASGLLPGKRANRFPVSPPRRSPASSTSTVAPIRLRIRSSRFAIAPSRIDRLEMQTRSRNSSFNRAASIIDGSAGITRPRRWSLRPYEIEEAARVDRQAVHRFVYRQALDLGDLLDDAGAQPGSGRHAFELSGVRPRRIALDQQRFERHG